MGEEGDEEYTEWLSRGLAYIKWSSTNTTTYTGAQKLSKHSTLPTLKQKF